MARRICGNVHIFLLLVLLLIIRPCLASVRWQPDMKSFSHSVKQGGCESGQEVSLFEFSKGPGVITEQWFTGKGCINQDTIIRYYIDGEARPSIEMNLYMGHGIGLVEKDTEDSSEAIGAEPLEDQKQNMNTKRNPAAFSNVSGSNDNSNGIRTKPIIRGNQRYNVHAKTRVRQNKQAAAIANTTILDNSLANPLIDLLSKGSLHIKKEPGSSKAYSAGVRAAQPEPWSSDEEAERRSEFDGQDDDPAVPWGTRRMGHVAHDGGLYNTFRIPFQHSVFVSLISKTSGSYWYNVRGVQNYPLVIGDLELPSSARLKLYKRENITVEPFGYIFLASVANKSGLLYQLTFNTESKTFQSLEACFRAIIDKENNTQYLSSGTEDLFLSSYYYSGGVFHTEQAGLSYKQDPGRMCAYKFFEDDPVLFNEAFSLIWRCGELLDNECFKFRQDKCLRKYGQQHCVSKKDLEVIADFEEQNIIKTESTIVNSYAWIYEW